MLKRNLLQSTALAAAVICMLFVAGCSVQSTAESTERTPSQSSVTTKKDSSTSASSATETEAKTTAASSDSSTAETEPSAASPASSATETEPPVASSEVPGSGVAKINGGADEVGIYSVVVRLTDQAADKGVVEMVYYGAKGSPQENSIVNTFRIEYYKEPAGTFEISTFYNGEVYQNQHHKDEVKVVNTFDATLRAGNVIISYTPDGGDTQEIFRADADYFTAP